MWILAGLEPSKSALGKLSQFQGWRDSDGSDIGRDMLHRKGL